MKSFVLAALLTAASGAAAATQDYGYQQIAVGNLAAAEATLESARQAEPDEPALLINLASVYSRTGRDADATMLYRRILDLENVQLDLGNYTPAWSHDLARRGLSKTQVAAR
jgi:Flp pilus assembly protein TadD